MENTSTASSLTSGICVHIHHGGLEGDTEKSLGSAYLSGKLWRVNSIKIKSRLNSAWAPPFPGNSSNKPWGVLCFRHGCQDEEGKTKNEKQPHLEFGSISYSTARLFTDWCFWSVTFLPHRFSFFKAWQQPAIDKSPASGTRRMHSDAITEHFPHEGGCAGCCCVWGGVCKKKKKEWEIPTASKQGGCATD